MHPGVERALRDLRAAFPKPASNLVDEVTRNVLRSRRGSVRRVRSVLLVAAALLLASFAGFSVGRWGIPANGGAASSISISARPLVAVAWHDLVQVYGAVGTRQAGQDVTVEAKECGNPAPFHAIAKTTTGAGGSWLADELSYTNAQGLTLGATTQLRAVWRNGTSDPITVQVRPWLNLLHPGRKFELRVGGDDFFGGAVAVVEWLAGQRWLTVRRIVLRRWRNGPGGLATFKLSVPRRTVIRLVLPTAEVKPCFLGGFSNTVKV